MYLNYYSSSNAIPNRTKLQKRGFIFIHQITHSKSSEILSETGEKVKIRIAISVVSFLILRVFSYHFNIFEFETLILNIEKMKTAKTVSKAGYIL